ncbi:Nucleolar pre-ribosomal-associated protein 1 C-terminal domain containing protein, partial [Cryptosporidium tyzzeri]
MDLNFNLNIRNCISNSNNKDDDCIYDLGFVIPIINSRFKLAYSVLRERGFQNSKNKNTNLMNDGIKEFDDTMEDERREGGGVARTCSGFVENYIQLSESRFFNKVIDNNFIWLRNFCKNGSLQLLVNSLSCTDISIRYYSYQTLSLLYEIISFHYNKYLQKLREQEKERESKQEQENEEEQGQEEDEDDEDQEQMETMNKKKRNKKLKKKHIRYIFKELPQVFMILNTLKNTVSGTLVPEHRESNSDKNEHEK